MQSAYRAGKHEARLQRLVTPMDVTHGTNTNNEPVSKTPAKQPNWTPRGRSEAAEGA